MDDTKFKETVLKEFQNVNKRLDGLEKGQKGLAGGQDGIRDMVSDFRQEFHDSDFVTRAEMNQAFKEIGNLTLRVEQLEQARA